MPLAVALLVHTALGALLLARRPETPPPETVMQVVLTSPPTAAAFTKPHQTAKHLGERPARGFADAAARPPLAPRPSSGIDWRVRPQPPASDGVRQTLRERLGCRTPDALALTREERAICDEQLARGADEARPYAVVSPKLKKQFDGVFECPKDDAWCEYRIGKGPYPGLLAPRRKRDPEWD